MSSANVSFPQPAPAGGKMPQTQGGAPRTGQPPVAMTPPQFVTGGQPRSVTRDGGQGSVLRLATGGGGGQGNTIGFGSRDYPDPSSPPQGSFPQRQAVSGGSQGGGLSLAPGMTYEPPDPFSQPTSAMDVYRSSVPVMKQDLTDRLSDAMATAGFSGNRFGSYAMNTAAQEGAKTGLQQNQLMTSLLHNQTNTDLDRALQAANMGAQHGQASNQMQLDRMRFLADQGRWEQGRQDLFERQRYEDFERNKLGFLPMLLQMAQSPGTATQGVWGNQQSGGSPGLLDWATLAAQIYGASQ